MFSSEERFRLYRRALPFALRRLIRPMIGSPESLDYFLRYAAIGAFVVGIDLLVLRSALALAVPRAFAVCLGLLASNCAEFSLNRWCNFRAFDRAVHEQFGKFALTAACTWTATLVGVEAYMRIFHFPALIAKVFTIPLTLPISFLASRYVIFAPASSRKTIRPEGGS